MTTPNEPDGLKVTQLLPCPFCGCPFAGINRPISGNVRLSVKCPSCHSHGGYGGTDAEAIAAWNERVQPDHSEDMHGMAAHPVTGSDMREAHGVQYATVRDGGDEWHIECRFKDGQKFAAVTVDKEHEALADFIAAALSPIQTEGEG